MAERRQVTWRGKEEVRLERLQAPRSEEAEQALLGAILRDSEALNRALEVLDDPSAFYVPRHRLIYEAMLALYEQSQPCDITTAANQLQKMATLEKIGGRVYLVELVEGVASTANVVTYANIVLEKWLLRRLIRTADEIAESCRTEDEAVDALLDKAESVVEAATTRQDAAEQLREIVATVGQEGQPGEQVRCVVAVSMLNEGWDAHNVTHILGVRAFGSQLLCEQVVGRGLRRMDYTVDKETGLLTEEYVDIYGVPFSLIPFKGRTTQGKAPEDKPKNHVRALPERAHFEIKFPVVEGYAFALRRNVITADLDAIDPLVIAPEREPTAVFVKPRVGYQMGQPSLSGPGEFQVQDRQAYYASTHVQTIAFEIARQIVTVLDGAEFQNPALKGDPKLRGQSRHQLFPQVLRLVYAYIEQRVNCRGVDPRELGQERYTQLIVERLLAAIKPDDDAGEAPLLPILNRYQPTGSTAQVDFKTTRPCFTTVYSHINLVAADTARWEQSAAFRLEAAAQQGLSLIHISEPTRPY